MDRTPLTEAAMAALAEIIRITHNHHAPQIIEAALINYLEFLKSGRTQDGL